MEIYRIENGKLTSVPAADMYQAGLKETTDLEAWVRDAVRIFDRDRVLWISRQERTTSDERADLVGICDDELLLVELKRGTVVKEAVSQALSYLSRIAKRDHKRLLDLYIEQAAKTGPWALHQSPLDPTTAEKRFMDHAPEEGGVNQFQTIILVGTDFDPESLQVCGYLNEHLGESTLTLECWQLHIFQNGAGYLCGFDKLLPSRDVEAEIQERRDRLLVNKGRRNGNLIAVMRLIKSKSLIAGLLPIASRGESYSCRIKNAKGDTVEVYLRGEPSVWFKAALTWPNPAALTALTPAKETFEGDVYDVVKFPLGDLGSTTDQDALAQRVVDAIASVLI